MEMTMAEKLVPGALVNVLFGQVEEMMGRRSLRLLLRQAGLVDYVGSMYPLDDRPCLTANEYSTLLANIYDIFGAQAARPILLRGGWLTAAELRRHRSARSAMVDTALRFLPGPKRMEVVLERLAEQSTVMYGAEYRLREEEDAFYLEISDCPHCAEIAKRNREQNRPLAKPVCHIPTATIDEMMEWATGERHLVEEEACIAQGAPACRLRIGK
jgi:hypothetical protein